MRLFYVGNDFYNKSGTMMAVLYHETPIMSMDAELNGQYYGSDWGKVESALRDGDAVYIRPANDQEMLWAYKKLTALLIDNNK